MSSSGFAHPPENRYLDDYVPGAVHEFGSIDVDERDVIEFGRRYGRFLITTHSGLMAEYPVARAGFAGYEIDTVSYSLILQNETEHSAPAPAQTRLLP
jgi:hypothetical protein